MTRKTTLIAIFTAGIAVMTTPHYLFTDAPREGNALYVPVNQESVPMSVIAAGFSDYDDDADIERALNRKNKSVYLASFRRAVEESGKIYTYKSIPRSVNVNSLYTYILEKDDQFYLHLMARYTSNDPVGFDHLVFYLDNEVIEYYPAENFILEESELGLHENCDILVRQPDEALLRKIINAEKAKVAFVGSGKTFEMPVTNNDKLAMERSLSVYNDLK